MFDLIRPELDATDRKLVDTLEAFYRETPAGLLDAPPETWPDLFWGRLAFESWRQRWLAYWAGLAVGPTNAGEYAALRPQLRSHPEAGRVDWFHA